MFKNRNFHIKQTKSFKNYLNVSRFKGEIPKTQEKTQNSRKKLKLWEDLAPPERPSGVIKKPVIYHTRAGVRAFYRLLL